MPKDQGKMVSATLLTKRMGGCSTAKLSLLFAVGSVFLIGGGIMIPIINIIIRDKIEVAVVIANDSMLYDIWQDPPIPIYMQFYMFNLTNPEEVKDGGVPAVLQKGPYTYREKRIKFDIEWNDNGTVTYKQNRTFYFVRDMSCGDEKTDFFITTNPVLLSVVESLVYAPSYLHTAVSEVLKLYGEDIFMTRSVKELLWGYTDPCLRDLHELLPTWFYTDQAGYFINKNATDDGVYTVFTGEKDISTLGLIDMYQGSRYLSYWSTQWANMVNGTDGTISPPFEQDSKILYLFSSDICRSVYGFYKDDVKSPQGISLHRFVGTAEQLANVTINPDNIGFCTPETRCLPSGLLNISNCQIVNSFHIPAVVSFPHFYLADPSLLDTVDGLSPNAEEHQTAVDVEPWTGQVLQAFKRLQINMYITKVPGISETYNVPSVYLPVFWLNESAVVDEERASLLQSQLFTPMEICSVLEKVFMATGAGIILTVIVIILKNCAHHQAQTSSTASARPTGTATTCQAEEYSDQEQTPLLRDGQQHASYTAAILYDSRESTPVLTDGQQSADRRGATHQVIGNSQQRAVDGLTDANTVN